jgi:hypothetical protein
MPLSDRDREVFEVLTRQIDVSWEEPRRFDHGRRPGVLVATAMAGVLALPVAITVELPWVGLVGFLLAVSATERLLIQLPRPNRRWLRDRGLLPTAASVDRRSFDGTMVTRRTFILPGRLIIVVLVVLCMVLLPLVSTTAVTP